MFDRASGELRFSRFLSILAAKHRVVFSVYEYEGKRDQVDAQEMARYRKALEQDGVTVAEPLDEVLQRQTFDAVLFEFYFPAQALLRHVRFRQPGARVIVDSVDVHFQRLFAKANVTGNPSDAVLAAKTKADELEVYRRADVVITVTDEDKGILLREAPDIRVATIPNIHDVPDAPPGPKNTDHSMIFVGNFTHSPNVDAVQYFCSEIFPLIRKRVPDARLRLVGQAPPSEILDLASDVIEVTGYVPETRPYLESSAVSIAPLRYGAGMKGKVGEALSLGLPVVTTAVGIEGFGLTRDKEVLVGDTPQAFSEHVVRLFSDADFYNMLRVNGWQFMKRHYSEETVKSKIHELFDGLEGCPIKRLPLGEWLKGKGMLFLDRYLLWRFR